MAVEAGVAAHAQLGGRSQTEAVRRQPPMSRKANAASLKGRTLDSIPSLALPAGCPASLWTCSHHSSVGGGLNAGVRADPAESTPF